MHDARFISANARCNTGGRKLLLALEDEKGDGHCFYRAVARRLYGDPEQHRRVRIDLCDYMESDAHWRDFAGFAAVDYEGEAYGRAHRAAFKAFMAPHRRSEYAVEPQHKAFRELYPDISLHVWRAPTYADLDHALARVTLAEAHEADACENDPDRGVISRVRK